MATIYCRSTDGDDGDDGSTWALAKATLQAAITAAGSGGTVYLSDDHSESYSGTVTLTFPSITSIPVMVLCVNDAGDPEPPTALSTGATITQTSGFVLRMTGVGYFYGVSFVHSGTGSLRMGTNAGADLEFIFENCTFNLSGSSSAQHMYLSESYLGTIASAIYRDCSFIFSHASQVAWLTGFITILGGNTAGTALSALFLPAQGKTPVVEIRGMDLTNQGAGVYLMASGTVTTREPFDILFENCKLDANVAVVDTTYPFTGRGQIVRLVNCDSGDTNYNYYQQQYFGTIEDETIIVVGDGATDGTTTFSRKASTNANTAFVRPLQCDTIAAWNDSIGSAVNATVEIITDGVSLDNQDIWLDIENLGNSGSTQSEFNTSQSTSVLANAVVYENSAASWTTTGLSSPTAQKLVVQFTPQEKGPVFGRISIARTNTVVYVDPLLRIA